MGKTYKALKRAEKEQNKDYFLPVRREPLEPVVIEDTRKGITSAEVWHKELTSKIIGKKQKYKTIMFTGLSVGDGVTTTALSYANSLVKNYNKKVMLLNIGSENNPKNDVYLEIVPSIDELVHMVHAKKYNFDKNIKNSLYISKSDGNGFGSIKLLKSREFDEFVNALDESFDFLIFDTAPIVISAESKTLAEKVDAVILVIEAGKARREVARKAKKEIENHNGNIIGVLMNKRKYYIPKWLYKYI